jgi:hypothetical protein
MYTQNEGVGEKKNLRGVSEMCLIKYSIVPPFYKDKCIAHRKSIFFTKFNQQCQNIYKYRI